MMILTLWIEAKRAPWSPDFAAKLLRECDRIDGARRDRGARSSMQRLRVLPEVEGYGGRRGPNLSDVGES